MNDWVPPSPETIDVLYVPMWQQALEWGSADAQEMSLYALRAIGWECWGDGYGDDFVWLIRHPDSAFFCRIVPNVKL